MRHGLTTNALTRTGRAHRSYPLSPSPHRVEGGWFRCDLNERGESCVSDAG